MMFAIEVEYLLGRSVATDREVRSEPEWPPHPQRLFSALVAAMKENADSPGKSGTGRDALLWLESLAPPRISVSEHCVRTRSPVYVPVNDESTPNRQPRDISNALKALPGERTRQERFFPTVVPDDPIVQFIWRADEDELQVHWNALQNLCERVGYLGHSSSLVRVAITRETREATLVPVEGHRGAEHQLRTVSSGRVQLLEETYERSVAKLRRMEPPDLPRTGYASPQPGDSPHSVFGGGNNWFVFERVSGKRLPLTASLALTSSVRAAVANLCDDAAAPLLLGHPTGSNSPVKKPHVAYVPLANVGHTHADGEIHGFAVVLPHDTDFERRKIILHGLGKLRSVWSNNANRSLAFDWSVKIATGEVRKKTLHTQTWTRKSRCWATTTPVVFGHFLRKLDDNRAFQLVSKSCTAIGLPEPINVRISNTSLLDGVPGSNEFPSMSSQGKPVYTTFRKGKHSVPKKLPDGTAVRMRYHVAVEFAEPVYGPVILGAGRYFGMGMCRPLFG